jgi:hypothetical protein
VYFIYLVVFFVVVQKRRHYLSMVRISSTSLVPLILLSGIDVGTKQNTELVLKRCKELGLDLEYVVINASDFYPHDHPPPKHEPQIQQLQ